MRDKSRSDNDKRRITPGILGVSRWGRGARRIPKQAVIREVQEELGVDGILKAEAEVITIDPRSLHFSK